MTAATTPFSRTPAARGLAVSGGFNELAVVKLVRAFSVGGKALPAGSVGTVVGVYRDGIGYEVEFERPFHAVVTLEAADL